MTAFPLSVDRHRWLLYARFVSTSRSTIVFLHNFAGITFVQYVVVRRFLWLSLRNYFIFFPLRKGTRER